MGWFLLVINVMLVNMILSGDNALAISMAAGRLPIAMRKKAIVYGSTIAIVLLILFTAIGTFIIQLPVLKAVAGLLLLWISIRMVLEHIKPESHEKSGKKAPSQLWKAISMIVMADLGMELDNAMAMLGAANGELSVLMAGFLCTIPFLIFGSHFISKVFDKAPWIVYVAATYIAYIAGHMMADDTVFDQISWNSILDWAVPVGSVVLFLAILLTAWVRVRRHRADGQAHGVSNFAEGIAK